MKINFEQDKQLPDHEIVINVKANYLDDNVIDIIHQLDKFTSKDVERIPISLSDHVQIININDIIAIEVFNNDLIIYTNKDNYHITGQLTQWLKKLNNDHFIKISRNAAININHLQALESSFSGNMKVVLDDNLQLQVSRNFLPQLKDRIRM